MARRRKWGMVLAVLVGAGPGGLLDPSAVAYWDAPQPLGGAAIVRGHRLGAPRDRIRFLHDQEPSLVHVLDPAAAYPDGRKGNWWRATRLRAGAAATASRSTGPGSARSWWWSSARTAVMYPAPHAAPGHPCSQGPLRAAPGGHPITSNPDT